jgi:segregation and condensation protein B
MKMAEENISDVLFDKEEKKAIVEAALFMSPEPIGIDKISKIASIDLGTALSLVNELMAEYENRPGVEIVRLEGGKYKMQVKTKYLHYVKELAMSVEMSKAVIKTLALIAFNQPIKQSEVVKIRGNKAYDQIKELLDKGFIKTRKFRNTLLLETTKKFDDYFGPIDKEKGPTPDQRSILEYTGKEEKQE